ncbi:MAG TPA: hypothetical protein ENI13_00285 [candidate division CPR3 bacterium]|uniref:Homeodomain phBC6A51-type domain-containing protein n=1 Tax=candidate division CPR3 bacterium TaxID=2268181 RepID=A0A7C1T1T7_UNCC3|nr:hypothetical protein [candidate division CPR3 bacterium]
MEKKKTDKTEQKLTEKKEVFKPTKLMIKWLDVAMELGRTATVLAVSEKVEASRTSWYAWIKDMEFVHWWDLQWQAYLQVNRWKLDAIGMEKAKTDYNYWHDMMERTGNIQPEESGVVTPTQVNIFNRAAKNADEFIEGEEV